MLNNKIILYAIIFNRENLHYQILSEHPDKYHECYSNLNGEDTFNNQLKKLFSEYFDLAPEYVRFLVLEPEILDNTINIPIYCLVPYLTKIKKGHIIPVNPNAMHIEHVRKILNII